MPVQTDSVSRLREDIAPLRRSLEHHPLYREIHNIQHLRVFLESHVFAVWDFMSLLKSLQARLTCVSIPWLPSRDPKSCRLMNEIVLGEESDAFQLGYSSHFEIYLAAMSQAGANTTSIHELLHELRRGATLASALSASKPPSEAAAFVSSTFSFINLDQPHVAAAAFTFGREDLIPDMFRQIVRDLSQQSEPVHLFDYYLNRHIDVDGDSHGPMALQMIEELCGSAEDKWEQASRAAQNSLEARIALWDGILARIRSLPV